MSTLSFVYKSLFDMPNAFKDIFKKEVQHSGSILTLVHIFSCLLLTYSVRTAN